MTTSDSVHERNNPADVSAKEWVQRLKPFNSPKAELALLELVITLGLFAASWYGAVLALNGWIWLWPPLVLISGCLLVRVFIVQHDCGHGSFLKNAKTNNRIGRALGVLTLTPYAYWRYMHSAHHAGFGCLDKRGLGDIDTYTVDEYYQLSLWNRFLYRSYRHPLVMFGLGPAYMFLLKHRYPAGMKTLDARLVKSVHYTNIFIALLVLAIVFTAGWKALLLVHLPAVIVAGSIGIWLFYVQHQFEHTDWDWRDEWQHAHSALHGSSFYDLPAPLMWLTGNIGIHHVHHLSTRIPFYRLKKVLKAYPELKESGRLTLMQSLRCTRLTLWDANTRRLISFKEARTIAVAK